MRQSPRSNVLAVIRAVALTALLALCAVLFRPEFAVAQNDGGFCPPGSTPVFGGGGAMCQCPDGSMAGMSGCHGGRQQSMCPAGYSYCGETNQCCGSGQYCSIYGCVLHGSIIAGNRSRRPW